MGGDIDIFLDTCVMLLFNFLLRVRYSLKVQGGAMEKHVCT